MIVIVMGVAGSGKTTIGELLATEIGAVFVDGDDLHPPENIERMGAGVALSDEDRRPWLRRVRAEIERAVKASEPLVIACSALKTSYRAFLLEGLREEVRLVYLKGDRAEITARMAARQAHFMPESLVETQFAILEEPSETEAFVVGIEQNPVEIVRKIRAGLSL